MDNSSFLDENIRKNNSDRSKNWKNSLTVANSKASGIVSSNKTKILLYISDRQLGHQQLVPGSGSSEGPASYPRFCWWSLIVVILLLSGCAGFYFKDAGIPPTPSPRLRLNQLPEQTYWTGIIFNGSQIGFSHTTLSPVYGKEDVFEIRSEVVLRFRFLMFDKRIQLKSYDRVADDLSLIRFTYEYNLDGNLLKVSGRVAENRLMVEMQSHDQIEQTVVLLEDTLYPTSAMYFFPILHGLEVGRRYQYRVYDMQTQTISEITQNILAYETSNLFQEAAYKVNTVLLGQESDTWMDDQGRPLLEMSINGVLISTLESESSAKTYLSQSMFNKDEVLLDYILIKSAKAIPQPKKTKTLSLELFNIDSDVALPSDRRQQCERNDDGIICRINADITDGSDMSAPEEILDPVTRSSYLTATYIIPSHHDKIRQTARAIVTDAGDILDQIRHLVTWMDKYIQQKPVDVFTALDVLEGKTAECQGHALLYTAFARSLDIPTRVVNGIVYSGTYKGFLYHTWAESWVDNGWVAVDPTFHQIPADATHVKLFEGENIADIMPMVDLVGKLEAQVIESQSF